MDSEPATSTRGAPAVRGRLGEVGYASLLRVAALARLTGALVLDHLGVLKSVWLRDGEIVGAASSDPDDRLGEWLLRRGRLGRAELERASQEVEPGRRLGAVLVDLGLLGSDELGEVVSRQLARIARSLFHWTDGSFEILPGDSPPPQPLRLALSTPDVVLRGSRGVSRWAALRRELGGLDQRYRMGGDMGRLTTPMSLKQEEWAILSYFGEEHSIREACEATRASDFRVHQALLAFWALGLVSRAEPVPELAGLQRALADARREAVPPAAAPEPAEPPPRPPVESGDLEGHFPELLRALYGELRTGLLTLRRDALEIRLWLTRGSIVAASSGDPEHRLGRVLARLGRDQPEERTRRVRACGSGPLGAGLVRDGLLILEELRLAVETQIREIVLPVFNWSTGSYQFRDTEPLQADACVSELSTAQIILEGIRGLGDVSATSEFLLRLNARFQVSRDPRLAFQQLELRPAEGFLLSRIDGRTGMAELIDVSPLGEHDTCRILYAFLAIGLVEVAQEAPGTDGGEEEAAEDDMGIVPPAVTGRFAAPIPPACGELESAHGSLGQLDHYQLLGIDRTAEPEDVDRAFQEMAVRYHPDRGRSDQEKEMLEAVFGRLVEAARTLRKQGRRRGYDELLAKGADVSVATTAERAAPAPEPPGATPQARAEALFRQATEAIGEEQCWKAICLLGEAVGLCPQEPAYHLLLGRTLARNPRWYRDAEKAYRTAMTLAPMSPEPCVLLGALYQRMGQAVRATPLFRKALALDPDNQAAKRGLGGPRKVESTFGEMFRKLMVHRAGRDERPPGTGGGRRG